MNSTIRLKSKYLLSQNTSRLFFISFLSAVIRWGGPMLNLIGLYSLLNSDFLKSLLSNYDNVSIFTIVALFYFVVFLSSALTASAVKLGEQFIYFTRAQNSKGTVRLLFKFLHPKKSIKALKLYLSLNFLKFFWLIYFLLPVGACVGCSLYLYNISYLSPQIYYTISFGSVLLFSISIVAWRTSVLKYAAAPFYICLNYDTKIKDAIKKSSRFTDGFLTDGVVLEYSFMGWFLSCFFIIPLFYVVPYIKLAKCVYITEVVFAHSPKPKNRYPVTLLKLINLSQHIN